jgi:NADPH:quinone reductase-like Zn-dependent oxidoreductase
MSTFNLDEYRNTSSCLSNGDMILLLNLLKQGKIKPIVAARMPLNQAAQAH